MKKIIFNDDEQKDIITMYLNFIPINQIREKYGVSKKPIYDVLKDNNIDFQTGRTNEKRLLIFRYEIQEQSEPIQIDMFKNNDTYDSNKNFSFTEKSIENSKIQRISDSSDIE